MGNKIEKGRVVSDRVKVENYSSIEHGTLKGVSAIVVHRTDSSSAKSTLQAYSSGKTAGAHFLIGKDGEIVQTASLEKVCWHVGSSSCVARKRAGAPRRS